jgi:hypothetical protein
MCRPFRLVVRTIPFQGIDMGSNLIRVNKNNIYLLYFLFIFSIIYFFYVIYMFVLKKLNLIYYYKNTWLQNNPYYRIYLYTYSSLFISPITYTSSQSKIKNTKKGKSKYLSTLISRYIYYIFNFINRCSHLFSFFRLIKKFKKYYHRKIYKFKKLIFFKKIKYIVLFFEKKLRQRRNEFLCLYNKLYNGSNYI